MALIYSAIPITLGYSAEVFSYTGAINNKIAIDTSIMPFSKVNTKHLEIINFVNTVSPIHGNASYIRDLYTHIMGLTSIIRKGAIERSKLFNMSMLTASKRDAIKDTIFAVEGIGSSDNNGMHSGYKFTRASNNNPYYTRYNLGTLFGRDRLIASVDTLDPVNTFRFIPVSEWGTPEVFSIVSKFTGVTAPTDIITSSISAETVFKHIDLIKSWNTLQEDLTLFFDGVSGSNLVVNSLLKKIGNTPSDLETLNLSYNYASWLATSIYPYYDSFFRMPELEDFKFYVYNLAKLYPYYTYSIESSNIKTSSPVSFSYWFDNNSYVENKKLVDYMRVNGMPFTGICEYKDITCCKDTFSDYNSVWNFDLYVSGPNNIKCSYGINEAVKNFSYDKYKALGYSSYGYNFVSGSTVTFEGTTDSITSPYNRHAREFLRLSFMDPRMFNNYASDEHVYLYMIEAHDDARVPESRLDGWYKGIKGHAPSQVYRHEQGETDTLYNPFMFYYPASKNYDYASSISLRRPLAVYNSAITNQYDFTVQRSFEINTDSFEAVTVDDYSYTVNPVSVVNDLNCIFTTAVELGIKGSGYNAYKTMSYSDFSNKVHNDIYQVLGSIINGIAGPIAANKLQSSSSFNLNNYTDSYTLSGSTEAQSIDMAYKTYWAVASHCYIPPSYACYLPILGNNNSVIPANNYTCASSLSYYGHALYELRWWRYSSYLGANGKYGWWRMCDCITANWGGADYSSTVYGYTTNTSTTPCYTTLLETVGKTTIFGTEAVMKTAGYRAFTCGNGKYVCEAGRVEDKFIGCSNYSSEICTNLPIRTKQLATMAYNNNEAYDKDGRNCLFPNHPWRNGSSRCCSFSDLNYGAYGESTFQMLDDIATYCTYDELDRALKCFIVCMYNKYASAEYGYYETIEQFILSAYQGVDNSKVAHINNVSDSLSVIDTLFDNYALGLKNKYLEVLSSRLLRHTTRTSNRRLIYAFKFFMESIKLIEVKKIKKITNVLTKTRTSDVNKIDPTIFKPMYEVYSIDAIRLMTTCVLAYNTYKAIPAIKTTFDLSDGMTEQEEDIGIVVKDETGKITYNSSTVGYNAIASFTVAGGPLIKVVPLDSVLSSSIFGTSNTYDLAISTNSADFLAAKNAVYSRTQLPKYSEFKVFTIPKLTAGTDDGFNYYRAKVLENGSVPSIYLYAEKGGGTISDTTVIVLGR